jgi:hypothetical protein
MVSNVTNNVDVCDKFSIECCKSDEIQFRTAENIVMDVRLELLAAQTLNIQAFWNDKPRFRKTRRNVCSQTRRNNSDD